jgi:hypothetical protein
MDIGTVVHELILGGDSPDGIQVLDFPDYRTNAARLARDSAKLAGKTPVLEKDYAVCRAAVRAVREQLAGFGIKLDGQSEGVGLWTERADDGTEVLCRCRVDHWTEPVIYDLKTTSDAHPDKCVRSIVDHGYDVQAAAYTSAAEKSFPELAGLVSFINIFVEMEPPYLVTPIKQDGSFTTMGRSKWRRAVNLWAKCLKENHWPGYATEPVMVSAPNWAVTQELSLPSTQPHTFEDAYVHA